MRAFVGDMARLLPSAAQLLPRCTSQRYHNRFLLSISSRSTFDVGTQAPQNSYTTLRRYPESVPCKAERFMCASHMRAMSAYHSPFSNGLRLNPGGVHRQKTVPRTRLNCMAGDPRAFSGGSGSFGGGMIQAVGNVAVFCASVYVGICALLYAFQRKLQYFPTTTPAPPADTLQTYLPGLEDFTTETEDGVRIQVRLLLCSVKNLS